MSIYTAPDGEARLSTIIVGTLYCGVALLGVLAWRGYQSLMTWAVVAGALAVFASICAAPGWIAAFWLAYVRKLPDAEIEEKRRVVNVTTAWVAGMATWIGAMYLFSTRDTESHWTDRSISIVFVIGGFFAVYVSDRLTALKTQCKQLETRIQQLEAVMRSRSSWEP